ncbi:MAG TPA: prepilin peptidase [Azospirillum sp.]|nr:prepilin peptidase [Azospirillum sp.]
MPAFLSNAAVALFCLAAVTDLHRRIIPNWITGALLLLFALAALADPVRYPTVPSLVAAVVVFVPLLAVFATGRLGGGDVKLLTAAALWAGWDQLGELLVVVGLAGGGLAVAYVIRHLPRSPAQLALWLPVGLSSPRRLLPEAVAEAGLPYGVAIAAGAAFVLQPDGNWGF